MPYDIETKDGIVIPNIPDDVAPDDPRIVEAVKRERSKIRGEQGIAPQVNPEIMGVVDQPGVGEKFARTAYGIVEQSVTGAAAEVVGGVLGAGEAALTGDPIAGSQRVQAVREAMIPDPSPETQQAMSALSEYIPEIGPKMGRFTFDQTGSPTAAAAAEAFPTMVAEIVGLGFLRRIKPGTVLIDASGQPTRELRKFLDDRGLTYEGLTPEAKAAIPAVADESAMLRLPQPGKAAENALIEQIKAGSTESSLAGLKVTGNRLEADKLGRVALKQGWAPGFVQMLKTATPQTKAMAEKMVDLHKRVKADDDLPSRGIRPSNVVGDSVTKRLKFLRDQANQAKGRLDQIAKDDLVGLPIHPGRVTGEFFQHMEDLDVRMYNEQGLPVGPGDKPATVVFDDSIIQKNPNAQRAVRDAIDLLTTRGPIDASQAHKIKRQLDSLIDFNKKSKEGLSEEGRRILKNVRHNVNQSIRSVHPGYAEVNDILSQSLDAIDEFDKASGSAIDIFGRGAESAIGTNMRKLLSNYSNRIKLENALNKVDETSANLGAEFKDSPRHLVMVANALDARGGAVAQTSLTSEVEKAMNRVLNQGMYQEMMGQTAGAASRAYRKMSGVNEFNAYESLRDILRAE